MLQWHHLMHVWTHNRRRSHQYHPPCYHGIYKKTIRHKTQGSYTGDYKNCCFLRCDAMYTAMWKECQMKEKSQESINGSHLLLDQKEDRWIDGKMMWEWTYRKWRLRIGRRVYWIEIHGGQLLSGPKLVQSGSVYKEEEELERLKKKAALAKLKVQSEHV